MTYEWTEEEWRAFREAEDKALDDFERAREAELDAYEEADE